MLFYFLGAFFLLMMIGVPVAFSMGGTALIMAVYLWGIGDLPLAILTQRLFSGANSFTMLAIPLFLFAGKLMNAGSITKRIFGFANSVVGHLPGGLGHVNILASVIFAGMSGTAAADAAGLGSIEIKAMEDAGYDTEFSAAVTGASSLIGPIIPPSVPMVMYGVLAEVPVGNLFIGGIIPGLLMAVAMAVMVWCYSLFRGYPRGRFNLKEAAVSFSKALLPLMTPVIIIGGIWTGVFTPTEAAVVAVFYALCLNLLLYRDMPWHDLAKLVKETVVDSASILFVIACVSVFAYALIRTQIPMILAEAVFEVTTDPITILLLLLGFFLIVGCFMSTANSIALFTPIFIPLIKMAGIDPVLFGVILVLTLMIGQLTPPFGIVLFVLTKVSRLSMDRVIKAVLPFTIPVLVVVLLCIFFPDLITYLPRTIG